jgi:hypothetical protein
MLRYPVSLMKRHWPRNCYHLFRRIHKACVIVHSDRVCFGNVVNLLYLNFFDIKAASLQIYALIEICMKETTFDIFIILWTTSVWQDQSFICDCWKVILYIEMLHETPHTMILFPERELHETKFFPAEGRPVFGLTSCKI